MHEKPAREILADPASRQCPCAVAGCAWHADCQSCVALHRYHHTIPNCLDGAAEDRNPEAPHT